MCAQRSSVKLTADSSVAFQKEEKQEETVEEKVVEEKVEEKKKASTVSCVDKEEKHHKCPHCDEELKAVQLRGTLIIVLSVIMVCLIGVVTMLLVLNSGCGRAKKDGSIASQASTTPPGPPCPKSLREKFNNTARLDDFCFVFNQEKKRYKQAKEDCESLGGWLAMSKDQETNDFLVKQLTGGLQKYEIDWWIGLHDVEKEGSFRWMDGTPLDQTNFTSWKPGAGPNAGGGMDHDCVCINGKGEWTAHVCPDAHGNMKPHGYICQYAISGSDTVLTTTTPAPPSTTPTPPNTKSLPPIKIDCQNRCGHLDCGLHGYVTDENGCVVNPPNCACDV